MHLSKFEPYVLLEYRLVFYITDLALVIIGLNTKKPLGIYGVDGSVPIKHLKVIVTKFSPSPRQIARTTPTTCFSTPINYANLCIIAEPE